MTKFSKTTRAFRPAATRRMASLVERAADAMGFACTRESSRISASEYVYIDTGEDDGLKVRISDHGLPASASAHENQLCIGDDDEPRAVVEALAGRLGQPAPVAFIAALDARSAGARKAAASRAQSAAAAEKSLCEAILPALRETKSGGDGHARRIARELSPDAAKAMVGRVAGRAVEIVAVERALDKAGDDPQALVDLASTCGKYAISRAAVRKLFALVGDDRARAMRPAGFLRSEWRAD